MEDRELIEQQLLAIKGISDLYMHGAIESSTAEVHRTFKDALNETLNIQNKIYNLMSEKGWYQNQTVDQSQINSTKQKFALN